MRSLTPSSYHIFDGGRGVVTTDDGEELIISDERDGTARQLVVLATISRLDVISTRCFLIYCLYQRPTKDDASLEYMTM